jgi:hypothetical protein
MMSSTPDSLPPWAGVNAWREVFTRIFTKTEEQLNVFPEWLVNPTTKRRLKLDLLYPEIGVAVRFEGLQGAQRRPRPSLEEEEQEQQRQAARPEVCRAHGIELIVVNPGDTPPTVFRAIDMALSRAGQRAQPAAARQKITQCRAAAADLARRVKSPHDLNVYAELWQDRQYQPTAKPTPTPAQPKKTPRFTPGMEVEHVIFGPGVVLAVTPSGNDTMLSVDFVIAGPKTLALSLVSGKLTPR